MQRSTHTDVQLLVNKKIKVFITILVQIVDWRIALVEHSDEATRDGHSISIQCG